MTRDQLPRDIRYGAGTTELADLAPTPEMGQGFGLGFVVRVATAKQSQPPGGVGTFGWYGVWGTSFWVDPADDMIGIAMLQAPRKVGDHYRELFRDLSYEAAQPIIALSH